MSSKLFEEGDSWGDSSGNSGAFGWSFKKTPKVKDKKSKKAKKRNHSEMEEDSNAGKWVRAPKFYGLEESDDVPQETSIDKNKKNRKRKHEPEAVNESSPDEKKIPEKKLKKQSPPVVPTAPVSYQEQLRESLKGSRFRFLNEQMYKQSGRESMKLFQEDETAFEAYHEGYRQQIAQWPMNPLERIINTIKRM